VVGAISWLSMARVVRGQVLSLRTSAFVEAARVQGASTWRIVATHVCPNVLSAGDRVRTLSAAGRDPVRGLSSRSSAGRRAAQGELGLLAADGREAIKPLASFWWLVAFPASCSRSTLLALGALRRRVARRARRQGPERAP
jgi:ABC-type dipeptide/oligopeptide/nickel transport system permease subunit